MCKQLGYSYKYTTECCGRENHILCRYKGQIQESVTGGVIGKNYMIEVEVLQKP